MADVITRLKLESGEYDSKIKRAVSGLQQMEAECRKAGGTLAVLDKEQLDYVKSLGQMQTASKSARGSLSELSSAYTELAMQYKRLTDEEKKGDFGKALSSSIDQLKVRIKETKTSLEEINREISGGKFGQFGGVIDNIGHKMGVTGNLTEMLTSKTALLKAGMAAAAVAVVKGAEAWAKYNQELARQDQQTTVITGLKGYDANMMTDRMRALSDTYKVDFRQAVEAANILMSQFGKSGEEAVKLIKDGMQGMILGDGPKLLNMIQQFAPAFVDAGISADKLIAIIHNSEGGLFSEHNMNAILMGIKNIRLMSTQTSNALAKLGIDGQEMSRKMSDGSMTVFDALRKVAGALENAKSGSKEAGEVMQYVFGRQGAMQGMKLARAIAELNLNLEETKKQTGEVGDAYAELQTANEKLAVAIRDCFGYDGWEQMATGIKSSLISALADVVNLLDGLRASWDDLMKKMGRGTGSQNAGAQVGSALDRMPKGISQPIKQANELKNSTDRQELYNRTLTRYNTEIEEKRQQAETFSNSLIPDIKATGIALKNEIAELQQMRDKYVELAKDILNPVKTTNEIKPLNNTNNTVKSAKIEKELNPIQDVQKQISSLTVEALTADDARLDVIKKEVSALNEQLKIYKEIQDYVKGIEPDYSKPVVADRQAFEASQKQKLQAELGKPTMLQSMAYSTMKEIKVENVKVDTETLHTLLKDAIQQGIDMTSLNLEPISEQIGEGINVPDEKWQEILDKYNELRKAIGEEPIQINLETGTLKKDGRDQTGLSKSVSEIGKISSGVGNIASGIQQLGIELPEGFKEVMSVVQGMTSILQGISTILLVIQALNQVQATSSIVPFFSTGGIAHAANGFVPGNNHTDDIPVMVSSGELILNRAQQGNLVSQLEGTSQQQRGGSIPYVSGEQIYLGLTNYLRRSGRGELLTARG